MKYFAWLDKYCETNIIAFGTDDEIENDELTGEDLDYEEFTELQDLFNDDGSLCEDYLISTNSISDVGGLNTAIL